MRPRSFQDQMVMCLDFYPEAGGWLSSECLSLLVISCKTSSFTKTTGARIDLAHHDNLPKKAFEETLMLDAAVQKAMSMTSEDDTLIIVTADHAHVFTAGGYTQRGNPILGMLCLN